MSKPERPREAMRAARFAERISTRIWQETPSPTNPYVADEVRCHGYELRDLMLRRSLPDTVYLLLRGELPNPEQSRLLERLSIALINPGPRSAACRAAVACGVGRTDPAHLLPVGLMTLEQATEVEAAMRFLRRQRSSDPAAVAAELHGESEPDRHQPGWPQAPGFGRNHGSADPWLAQIAEDLADLPAAGACLRWARDFTTALSPRDIGWLPHGLAAAVLADLGFPPRSGPGLYQWLRLPGILAHGLEYANKDITALPYVDDSHYDIHTEPD